MTVAGRIATILAGMAVFAAGAQGVSVSTIAGGGGGHGGPGPQANVSAADVVTDDAGNVYIADISGRVRRLNRNGIVETLWGVGSVRTSIYYSIGRDAAGNLYLPDDGGILRLGPSGATLLPLSFKTEAIAVDAAGNIFAVDSMGGVVRRVAVDGAVSVYAGTGLSGYSGDGGSATSAQLNRPSDVAVDGEGNLYIADSYNHRIRKVTPAGTITTFAGTGGDGFSGDGGPAGSAMLSLPMSVSTGRSGEVFISDAGNSRVRKVAPGGTITTIAGGGNFGSAGDGGPATSAALRQPRGVAVDAAGRVFIADFENRRLRRVDLDGTIQTAAGNGAGLFSGDGGPATLADLNWPKTAFDAAGNLWFSDPANNRVRRIATDGTITTMAGTGQSGFAGDGGPAAQARLNLPGDIAFDPSGALLVVDHWNYRIRRVGLDGVITTIAGTGERGFSGDNGPAMQARFSDLQGLVVDPSGTIYVVDNLRVRRIQGGIVTTFAGNGFGGTTGDGGPATAATIGSPRGLALDTQGNLYIAQEQGYVVRRVSAGIITTVAGNGSQGSDGDGGPAAEARLDWPRAVAVDAGGNLYIGERHGVRKVNPAGTITRLAGTGGDGVVSDASGDPLAAHFQTVTSLTLDASGRLHIGDTNWRIRKAGSIAYSTPRVDFSAQAAGTTRVRQVSLTNVGPSPVSLEGLAATGGFGVSHGCGSSLAAAATCVVNVSFTPLDALASRGSLLLPDDGLPSVALVGHGERSLVRHYYSSILGREGEEAGVAYWESERARVAALGADVSEVWFAMAIAFFGSPEYVSRATSDDQYLVDLYRTFFNRSPDAAGAAYWKAQIDAGMSRHVVLLSFLFSGEFDAFTRSIFGTTDARAEADLVMDFFRGIQGRLPDSAGFQYWLGRMRNAQCQNAVAVRREVEAQTSLFFGSPEYAARGRGNRDFVGDLYNTMMRRGSDLDGQLFWEEQLQQRSRDEVRREFIASPEFEARVQAVVAEGCAT